MLFSDPFFGSSSEMVRQFSELFERPPSYDAAACTSAGISASRLLDNLPWADSHARRSRSLLHTHTPAGKIGTDWCKVLSVVTMLQV